MSNDFGGGFDASDEATKVAAPPLADLALAVNLAATPIATGGQPTDGIGIRNFLAGDVVYAAGMWSPGFTAVGTQTIFNTHPVTSAGTQAIDISAQVVLSYNTGLYSSGGYL